MSRRSGGPTKNPADTAVEGLDQRGVVAILGAADALRRRFATVLEPRGLTLSQYNVLRILRGAGPGGLRTMEIADRMLEKTPGVTRLLDRLEAQGWVERRRSTRDRRVVRCAITESALELLAELDPGISQADRECLEGLDDERKRRLVELLEELLAGLGEGQAPGPGPGSAAPEDEGVR